MIFAEFFNRLRRPPHPILAPAADFFGHLDHSRPIASYEFVVYDTELTGLNPRRDEIVSIGAVRIKDLRILIGDSFEVTVKPGRNLPKNSTLIHRITPERLSDAPALAEVLPDFLAFCGTALLVGHYVGLDASFINRATKKLYNSAPANPCLDTMRLAQIYTEMTWENYHDRYNLNVSYNLADLSRTYKLPTFARHDALADALQTAYLFLYLVKKMQSQGITTLKDLFNAGQSWRWIF